MSGVSTSQHPSVATAVDDAPTSVVPAERDQTISAKPARAEVLEALVAEAHVSRGFANHFLNWWTTEVVPGMRASNERKYFLPEQALNDPRKHGILDAIAPDDITSTPGSAMDMVERFSLDIERGEVNVVHGKARVYSRVYCQVTTRTVGFTV